jgi:hypothetical protein
MDDFTLMLAMIVIAGLIFGTGYLTGRTDQRNLLSEHLKIATWQRDEAIAQRDLAVEQVEELQAAIEQTCQEVTRVWKS